jgi:branched-chain amino acid aminotransferase
MESFEQCWLTGTAAEVTPVAEIGPYSFEVGQMVKDMVGAYDEMVRA